MIPKNLTCCCCHNLIIGSPTWARLDLPAAWTAPTWGNVITGESHKAVALICDPCAELDTVLIDYITEFSQGAEILHPLDTPIEFKGRS